MDEVPLYGHHVPCQDIRTRDVTNCRLLACFLGNHPMNDLGTVLSSHLIGSCTLR